MSSLPLALTLSLLLTVSAPVSALPAASLAEPAAVEEPELAAAAILPSSKEGEPVTREVRLPVLTCHHVVCDREACNETTVTMKAEPKTLLK